MSRNRRALLSIGAEGGRRGEALCFPPGVALAGHQRPPECQAVSWVEFKGGRRAGGSGQVCHGRSSSTRFPSLSRQTAEVILVPVSECWQF